MNIVFYILVAIVAFIAFILLSSQFEKIGGYAIRGYNNIVKNTNEKNEGENNAR